MTLAAGARAWVETSVLSDFVTIGLQRDGSATVAHELMMKVRGGPLRSFELAGVDTDADLLPDGTVTRARSGKTATTPIPLLFQLRDDGTLELEIDHKKGIRRGTYLFRFNYRTHLGKRDLITQDGSRVQVTWVGPRFADGIDSARVVFRVPAAQLEPRLPPVDSERVGLGLADDPGGVFLSNLRRAPDRDELEIVRPHIAKGEPVVWRMQADASAFDGYASPEPSQVVELAPEESSAPNPRQRALLIAIAFAIALVYGVLVVLKWVAFSRSCAIRHASARALVPLPTALRAALAGASLSAAAGVAVLLEQPTLGGGLLVIAMALAAHRGPLLAPLLRGPGRWLVLDDDDALGSKRVRLPGRWLDTGAFSGFLVFATALVAFGYGAARLLPVSPYHALLLGLASACLLPIFCTGRASELPADPATAPRGLMKYLVKRLRRRGLKAVAWARIPTGSLEPDELRLLVTPPRALPGLAGIEVGLEYQQGGGGPVMLPFVLVRVQDGSDAYTVLQRHVSWMRGREPEQRVAVIRPKLPTRQMALALVVRIAERVTDPRPESGRQRRASSPRMRRAA